MKTELVPIDQVHLSPDNPRVIKGDKFKKLVKSIEKFPEMLKVRPIVVDDDMVVLGGNMRLRACLEAGLKEVHILKASEFSDEQKREFVIKDNSNFGEWDWDTLANEWDVDQLDEWGVKVPTIKNTELLSGLEYKSMYYEPKKIPNVNLKSCADLSKFEQKVKALDSFDLTDEQKEVLKLFAYRFIKIDFENVANYYFFNASEEEQKAIERLRLVLTDDGGNGFIEDDLLKIYSFTSEGFDYD